MEIKNWKKTIRIYATILSILFAASILPTCAKSDVRVVKTKSYADVLKLFNEIGFTSKQWQAGVLEVPRIEITRIPKRWQEQSPNIPIRDKKNVFFRLAGPGILIENEKITADRVHLLNTIQSNKTNNDQWLLQLAKKYKVIKTDGHTLNKADLTRLKNRVDIIPPSLALAQAAEESGWGTSRFAIQGNSLFGQWDFSGNGIKPKNPRKELGNYGIAKFDTPQQSVEAYILNLNTHRAYKRLRDKRANMRASNIKPTGWELAKTLDKYSERGTSYVKSLHNIMSYNKLMPADDAYLWNKGTIIVSPAP